MEGSSSPILTRVPTHLAPYSHIQLKFKKKITYRN